jgi:hypothetical protein
MYNTLSFLSHINILEIRDNVLNQLKNTLNQILLNTNN